MLADEVLALAATGGATLVAAMATDAWTSVKAGFAKLFAPNEPERRAAIATRLEQSARQVADASGEQRDEVEAAQVSAWTIRLQDLLEEDSNASDTLRALVSEYGDAKDGRQSDRITQSAGNNSRSIILQAGRDINGTGAGRP